MARATHVRADSFNGAVIRLTAYYTIGVCVILLAFNVLVYTLISADIQSAFLVDDERGDIIDLQDESISHEIKENLIDVLITTDGFLLIITISISYLLARRTLTPLAESYERQKRFISDAAHELRTPLSVMKAGTELILNGTRSESEYKTYVIELQEEVERIIRLSNDLLILAQHEGGTTSSSTPFLFSNVCETACKDMSSYAVLKGVTLNTSIESNVSLVGNENDMLRLVLNLLKNAIDYNRPEGTVTLTISEREGSVFLIVSDTGVGIDEIHFPHIFERFYKVDQARRQKDVVGSGLGLSIVKEIC
ncbi:MAG: HAMP domain-containing histidine kinase, partial [Candidatus Kaiserbacteria bacterium]|nr:HAMP domain-containing histidine kinase [Candidatus Kaiserbacteria bacterium]